MKLKYLKLEKESLSVLLILFGMLLFSQCQKNKTLSVENTLERIEGCKNNALTDSLAIVNNLIGTWKLIGYDCGYCAAGQRPKIEIEFMEKTGNLLTQNESNEPVSTTFEWEVTSFVSNQPLNFQIKTKPFIANLQMEGFCSNYLYLDYDRNVIADGVTFLYQKQ